MEFVECNGCGDLFCPSAVPSSSSTSSSSSCTQTTDCPTCWSQQKVVLSKEEYARRILDYAHRILDSNKETVCVSRGHLRDLEGDGSSRAAASDDIVGGEGGTPGDQNQGRAAAVAAISPPTSTSISISASISTSPSLSFHLAVENEIPAKADGASGQTGQPAAVAASPCASTSIATPTSPSSSVEQETP